MGKTHSWCCQIIYDNIRITVSQKDEEMQSFMSHTNTILKCNLDCFRFGRRTTVIVFHTVRCLAAYLCRYGPYYETFIVGRIFMGITSPNVNLTMYVISKCVLDFTSACKSALCKIVCQITQYHLISSGWDSWSKTESYFWIHLEYKLLNGRISDTWYSQLHSWSQNPHVHLHLATCYFLYFDNVCIIPKNTIKFHICLC